MADPITMLIMINAMKKRKGKKAKKTPGTALGGILSARKGPSRRGTEEEKIGEELKEPPPGPSADIVSISDMHITGLPNTLPVGTAVKNPSGKIISTSSALDTSTLLAQVPPGTQIVTPTGISYTTPGAPAIQPAATAQAPISGLTPTQQLYLAGATALAPAIAPTISAITGAIGSFWDWATSDDDNGGTTAGGADLGGLVLEDPFAGGGGGGDLGGLVLEDPWA